MKKLFCTLFLGIGLLISSQSFSQQSYTTHKIKAGESLSGLAKKYHTTVGDIMRLNKMNQHSQLKIGATIKIPSGKQATASAEKNANNSATKSASQKAITQPAVRVNPSADPAAVTHVVKKGETLYQISQRYNVPVLTIMNLNNLATADLKAGQVLIVRETLPVDPTSTQAVKEENELRIQKATKEVANNASDKTTKKDANNNATNSVNNSVTNSQTSTADSKAAQPTSAPQNVSSNAPAAGYFTSQFGADVEGRDLQTKSGSSMVFKTESGWNDRKYYVLMDDVPPGSIVKVTSDDNKTIYAKVLWSLGKMKENEGLTFRISDAAAAALGVNDSKFNLTVTYYE